MLDNIMELLGESTDVANRVAQLDKKLEPLMAQVRENEDKMNPELVAELNKQTGKLSNMRAELEALKSKVGEV